MSVSPPWSDLVHIGLPAEITPPWSDLKVVSALPDTTGKWSRLQVARPPMMMRLKDGEWIPVVLENFLGES